MIRRCHRAFLACTRAAANGFTLLELLVVIVILGVLVSVALPTFFAQTVKAKDSAATQYLVTAWKSARAEATTAGDSYPASTSLLSDLQADQPQLTFSGIPNCSSLSFPTNRAIDIDTTSTDGLGTSVSELVMYDRSDSGTVWRLTAGLTGGPTLTSAACNGQLVADVFNGPTNVVSMLPDGSSQTVLTTDGESYNPVYSPDGTKIAYDSYQSGYDEIYVMNADGSGKTQLTSNGNNGGPAWSPDGTKIAFYSDRSGTSQDLYVMNADGSNQTRLTSDSGDDMDAAWSPDGTKIAYDSNEIFGVNSWGDDEIWVVNADGSNQQMLTTATGTPIGGEHPSWSPDGTKIAFDSDRNVCGCGAGGYQIFTMNADGSDQTPITSTGTNQSPSWAPAKDGNLIAYSTTVSGRNYVYVMNADGSNKIRVTGTIGNWFDNPSWNPTK